MAVWTANAADNSPLDADGTVTISGGTVLAAGGSGGMGMNLSAQQPCVTFGSTSGMMGGKGSRMGGQRQPPDMQNFDGQKLKSLILRDRILRSRICRICPARISAALAARQA